MYVMLGPYALLAVIAIASIVAVHRDLISTTQFRIMIIGAGVLAFGWTGVLGGIWLEYR
jgi:hypothetical protein